MARPLRIERPGGWYHLTARGNERRPIFRDDRDRQHFRQLLAEMVDRLRLFVMQRGFSYKDSGFSSYAPEGTLATLKDKTPSSQAILQLLERFASNVV